jgi:hypothetical protein
VLSSRSEPTGSPDTCANLRARPDQKLVAHFDAAKARVADMDVRYILLDGPIERTIFEVYAALALDTLVFNSFETH